LVEIASEDYARTGFPAIPHQRELEADERFPLRMVTPKALFRTHSQYYNLSWFREREPQVLEMHPDDAATRQIADGQLVKVVNERGAVRVPVQVSTGIMPGVVALLAGAWPSFDADGTDTSGCANVLTATEPTLPSRSTRTHSVWVQVRSA
jgi:anaerobic dimethyl sulfoxide reductase subunit A